MGITAGYLLFAIYIGTEVFHCVVMIESCAAAFYVYGSNIQQSQHS